MNWTLFADLARQIDQPFLQAVAGVTNSLLAAVRAPFAAAAVLYVAMLGWMVITGRTVEPMREIWFKLMKVAVVGFILGAGAYHQYVSDFFLNGIPADITGAITGSAGTISAQSFDHVWNQSYGAGLEVWRNLSMTDFGMELGVMLFWLVAAISAACGFLIWFCSHVLLGLLVAVGPLVLPLFLFPATRSIFDRWIGALLGMIFLQVFVVTLLVVLIGAEGALLSKLAGSTNPYEQMRGLFAGVILFVICAMLLVQLPGVATALAGGVHFHAHAIGRATFGRAMGIGSNVVGSGGRMITSAPAKARAALSAPPMRPPPGPSMSNGAPGKAAV